METIHNQIEVVARKVFQNHELSLTDATTASDVEKWDSLTHIQFVIEIEKAFGVKFKNAEIARMQCIGDLKKLVRKHKPALAA
jgi:acyl carrier protein